jgi:hypothetical protein
MDAMLGTQMRFSIAVSLMGALEDTVTGSLCAGAAERMTADVSDPHDTSVVL